MKKIQILLVLFLLVSAAVFSQSYKIQWGEEIKLKKGTADLDIVAADNSGLYFSESRLAMKSYFVIGASYGESIKLIKLNNNFGEVYEKEYKKELKGLGFHSFQILENDLYMFATDYEKKERRFVVYGAKVDKSSGEIPGDFQEIASFNLESKKDDYEMRMTSIQGENAFLMVSNISNKDRVTLGVYVLDKDLKRKENAIINLSFNPNQYILEDVKFTAAKKIVLLGKEFEESATGKNKRKKMIFRQYVMSVYDKKGKKETEIKLDNDEKYIISGKLIEQANGELLLAGFYCNDAKKKDLNGFYISRVDPVKGSMTLASFKAISPDMLGKSYVDETDDDEMSKREKKEAKKAKDNDDEDEFPNSYVIRSVDVSPVDNSVIITGEVSKYSIHESTSYDYNEVSGTTTRRSTTTHRFTNNDVLIINADKDGRIKWLNMLHKAQKEEISSTRSTGDGFSITYNFSGYFAKAGALPYYSSYKTMLYGNNLIVLMNDHNNNHVNPAYNDKVKTVYNFRKKSSVYGISIDIASGKMTRKLIASNNEETILMPRHAYVVNNDFYVPSWRQKLMAKTELKFAKITVK